MKGIRVVAVWLVAIMLMAWSDVSRPASAGTDPTVPNVSIPGTYTPVGQGKLNGDPHFPVLLLKSAEEGFPRLLLVVLDARTEEEMWSLARDPVVFYLLAGDDPTDQHAFLDKGFAEMGTASGEFVAAGPEKTDDLLAQLVESHQRLSARASSV